MTQRPRTQREARYLGAIAGGAVKNPHLTQAGAHTMLRNVKVSKLPKRRRKKP